MCGIIVCEQGYEKIDYLESCISHRGRSAHKKISRFGFTFSHFLHSIVGNKVFQPFEDEGVLVANCEIYNWKELCKKHNISARNDAELLFKLLESIDLTNKDLLWLLNELDGDYACVYYRNGKIIAFRDPVGVNPLFYSLSPLLFISERCIDVPFLRELHPRTILIYDVKYGAQEHVYNDLFSAFNTRPSSQDTIKQRLFDAVDKRISDVKSGILFSGGIDSIFIALRMIEKGQHVRLYTTCIGDNSSDLDASIKFADMYGLELNEINVSADELSEHIPFICSMISSCDSVKVSVSVPMYFSAREASKHGVKILYSGLGSDDLLVGYHRFKGSHNIHNEQLSSLRCIYERDTYRDNTACMRNGIELRVPFLDKHLINECLRAPNELLRDKIILRNILKEHYLLDEHFYGRPKKAAQYGSNSMKFIRKIAKSNGETVNSYLFSIYPNKNIKLGALYTGGKDSAYALYLMKLRNYDISCLISVKSSNPHSFMYHTPRIDAVKQHSKWMGIPLIMELSKGHKEEELNDLRTAICKAVDEYGIEGVITGALYSDYQRTRIEKLCDELGIRVFSPLWHVDQEIHMKRLLKHGFKFIITSVSSAGLGDEWVGKEISFEQLEELKRISSVYGINISGEGGEYESLVTECPLFSYKAIDEKDNL